ncbi:hypothetical protein CDAR_94501 [Caerostris darwini]|uniref:Uncharacterized protein n=1 Tax=Caerostris darwini TaxID=1538125 RepID=A0AAV4SN66_9ARAC|nr:hypothetical protein CDAR_94501 [Caerostris darwini]
MARFRSSIKVLEFWSRQSDQSRSDREEVGHMVQHHNFVRSFSKDAFMDSIAPWEPDSLQPKYGTTISSNHFQGIHL